MNEDITRLDYSAIANRYDLGTLKQGGDLQLTPEGDLKTTRDGDLQLGNDVHNALHRLVVQWQFNAPALKTVFDIVAQARATKLSYEEELNRIAPVIWTDAKALERWHEIRHELGVETYGPEAYAGTITVVLSALLRREWADLGKPNTWYSVGHLFAGQSFGAIVEAGANNFRHFDEWATTTDATPPQLKSMRVLAPVLGLTLDPNGKRHPIRTNVCPEVVMLLSGGVFEALMDEFFNFGRSLAGLN